jgi:hypothetical protein
LGLHAKSTAPSGAIMPRATRRINAWRSGKSGSWSGLAWCFPIHDRHKSWSFERPRNL